MKNGNLGYKPYWVAYFDWLGFENKVRAVPPVYPRQDEYRKALVEIRKNPKEIRYKCFSDTFLLYTPDDSEKSCDAIMVACERFFYRMMTERIPVRGCLTVGDFFEDDDVLVGPALIEAHKLAEDQDWLGFVLSPDAVRRCEQYGVRRDCYREYDVPIDHSNSARRLEAFIVSHRFPPFPPYRLWGCLDAMESDALIIIGAKKDQGEGVKPGDAGIKDESARVLRKYQNSKKYLHSLYPQLSDCVRGESGPILLNKPEVKRKIRELPWRLK